MNREQMVEQAARTLAALEPDEDWPSNAALGGSLTGTRDDEYRDGLRDQAREVLDAVLPQVTTVAELEALPDGAFLATPWQVYRWRARLKLMQEKYDSGYDCDPLKLLVAYGTLTVVWQPEAGDRS